MAADVVCWNNLPSVILYEIFSYLPVEDKVRASSTCSLWRSTLYHPSFWKSVHFRLKYNDANSILKTNYLISCSSNKLRNAVVSFDSMDVICVEETSKVLQSLSDNRNLRTLFLVPSHCSFDCPGHDRPTQRDFIDRCILKPVEMVIKKCLNLEMLSMGCSEELTIHSDILLDLLARYQSSSLHTLALASVKDDPDDYIVNNINTMLFESFRNLQILSLDYDYLNDKLLSTFSKNGSLLRLVVHVHGIIDGHPGTTEDAWTSFTRHNPKCELRMSLIHSYDAVEVLHPNILKRGMPMTHLRAFFCEKLNTEALLLLCRYELLRSIWWVDSFNCPASGTLIQPTELDDGNLHMQLNPFVMTCWRCTKLQEVVIFGYKYFAEDVCAMTRLRGSSLQRLDLALSDIVIDPRTVNELERIQREASDWLGQSWSFLRDSEVHSVILSPTGGDSDEFIIPVLLEDLQS